MTAPGEAPVRGWLRLTLQGWVRMVLATMAVLVFGFAGIGVSLLGRSTSVSDELVDRISPARTEIGRLQGKVLDQETGIRGYLLTGDRQFLAPYTNGVRDEAAAAGRISALVGGRPQLMADLKAVQDATAEWRRLFAEPIVTASAVPPESVVGDRLEASRHTFDGIRARFETQNLHIDEVRAEARAELRRIDTRRNWALLAMLAAFLLTGVALALLLQRTVGRPLRNLREASRQVVDGDFERRLPAHGPADIRALTQDIEAMRQRIVAALAEAREQETTLARQADELRRSNAELEQFAYVASHDLQEPLRKVTSFCQLIEKRYGDQLDDRGKQYIDFAVDGAKRMQVLINDLLTFSRVGRLDDARKPVRMDAALDAALKNLAASVEDSGARIDRPDTLPELIGDPTLLTMLWQNLIGNAIKFHVEGRAPLVTIECHEDTDAGVHGGWRFEVTDNGIGIPATFADKVFVIFQRLHSRDTYGGTGIGLALCKKIVEHHGGQIWIDTQYPNTENTEGEPAGGTRICFTLPAAPNPVAHGATDTALEGSPA
jgi:signal transduction histidine kinase